MKSKVYSAPRPHVAGVYAYIIVALIVAGIAIPATYYYMTTTLECEAPPACGDCTEGEECEICDECEELPETHTLGITYENLTIEDALVLDKLDDSPDYQNENYWLVISQLTYIGFKIAIPTNITSLTLQLKPEDTGTYTARTRIYAQDDYGQKIGDILGEDSVSFSGGGTKQIEFGFGVELENGFYLFEMALTQGFVCYFGITTPYDGGYYFVRGDERFTSGTPCYAINYNFTHELAATLTTLETPAYGVFSREPNDVEFLCETAEYLLSVVLNIDLHPFVWNQTIIAIEADLAVSVMFEIEIASHILTIHAVFDGIGDDLIEMPFRPILLIE